MKLSKQQIQQQREAIDGLYELVKMHQLVNVKIQLWHTAKDVLLLATLALKILKRQEGRSS